MIRRLRITLIAVMTVISSIFLVSILLSVYFFNSYKVVQYSMTQLGLLVNGNFEDDYSAASSRRFQLPYFMFYIDEYGTHVLASNSYKIDDENVELLNDIADKVGSQDVGVLEEYSIRYMSRKIMEDGRKIACIDISHEDNILNNLIWSMIYIGLMGMLTFFVASCLFAKWAVNPVEKMLTKQRRFVGDASHELKTPLTVILSASSILNSHQDETVASQHKWLENIQVESVKMKELVDDLLSLTRNEDFSQRGVSAPLNFSELVTGAMLQFDPILYEQGLHSEYSVADSLWVNGNAEQLDRALYALFDNAQKYASPGGTIRVVLTSQLGRRLLFSIYNDGVPIERRNLERIFERLVRLDNSRNEKSGGYGLGLAIASDIVEAHRGTIYAESNSTGNTFFISLPQIKRP